MNNFSKYHFKDLNGTEDVVQVLHRNWFYLLQQFFFVGLIAVIFIASLFYLPIFFPTMGAQFEELMPFLKNFFMLIIWMYGFLIWIDYYFDIWIITTERIINIEQKGMFTRSVSELRISKIQDITTEVKGFLPTIINFGDVKVQTAGEENEFIFRTVSDPYQVKNIIMELQKKVETAKAEDLGEMIKEKIEE